MEKDSGSDIDLEKKRLQLVRQAVVPGRLIPALREAIRKFPKEAGFRQELRAELEKEGRYHEAIVVLQGLVELEPEQRETSRRSAGAWIRLAHPVKARAVLDDPVGLRPSAGQPTEKPGPPRTRTPRPQASAKQPRQPASGSQELPLPAASTQLIKAHYEAGELDQARLVLRQLWRRFDALDQASTSSVLPPSRWRPQPLLRVAGPARASGDPRRDIHASRCQPGRPQGISG